MYQQHGISTSQQTQDEPNQFQTVNSIYELQSIINRLSIQKQKNLIAYTLAVKQQDQIISSYSNILAELSEKNKDQEAIIGELEDIVEKQRERYRRVVGQKEALTKLMETQVDVGGGMVSVYFVIVDYKRVKKELTDKNQQLSKLQQELLTKQMKLNQSTIQNTIQKKNLTAELQNFQQKLNQTQTAHTNKTTTLLQQLQQEQANHIEQSQQQAKHINELQEQILANLVQIKEYRKNLQEIKNAYNSYQYLQVQRIEKQAKNTEQVLKNKYEGLVTIYEEVLDQKQALARQKNIVDNQLAYYKKTSQKYQQQVQALRAQVINGKQIIDKMGREIVELELQNQVRKMPNDNLVKLQELCYQYDKDRKKSMTSIAELSKNNVNLSNSLMEKQKEVVLLQQRNRQQSKFIQNLQKTNRKLSQQLQNQKNTINNLTQSIQTLQNQLTETKLKLTQLEILTPKTPINPNTVHIQTDKYTNMMTALINIRKQNDVVMKQNVWLKEYVRKIQGEIVERSKDGCQRVYEIAELGRKLEIANVQCEGYRQKIGKLENSLENVISENSQDRSKLLNKIEILKECVEKMQKFYEQYGKSSLNKVNKLETHSKTLDFRIQGESPVRIQRKPTASKQPEQIFNKNTIQQIKSIEYLAVPDVKSRKNRTQSDINPNINIQNKLAKKQHYANQGDEDLDKIIRQLKKHNKSLSISYCRTQK